MRLFLLVPILVIVPFAVVSFAETVSGDLISGVVLGLTVFIVLISSLGGRPEHPGRKLES